MAIRSIFESEIKTRVCEKIYGSEGSWYSTRLMHVELKEAVNAGWHVEHLDYGHLECENTYF